jgi:hypothetical protein
MTKQRISMGLAAILALVFLFRLASRFMTIPEGEYRTFASPDGRFKVVVYRSRQWLGAMPGQAGDAPGSVCLYETANGKLLERKRVEMIQLVDQVTWPVTNVDIKLIADWKLP